LTALERDWRQHCGADNQQDDATILLLENLLSPPDECYEAQLSPESIPDFRRFFEGWARWAGLSEEVTYQVVLAGDELLTNIYRHAYKERPGPMVCLMRVTPFALELTLRHQGDPHQPAIESLPRPEDSAGGRGLPYIRSVFDRVEFVTLNQGGEIRLVRSLAE
jgi:anti-sigma regulatory factor (Ser/Thr protein kinase)